MLRYRLYVINPIGATIRSYGLKCQNDERAAEAAADLAEPGLKIEIWEGTRCVRAVVTDVRSDQPAASPPSLFADLGSDYDHYADAI